MDEEKKEFSITIAGFKIGKKQFKILLIIGLAILVSVIVSGVKRNIEDKRAQAAAAEAARLAALGNNGQQEVVKVDIHAEIQKQLSAQFGDAPEGFEWGYTGELVALGNDDDSSCEDVVYMFVRALSILDFSTAERYSTDSRVIDKYKNYYGEVNDAMTNYYNNFLRKQFKESLTSIEINNVADTAVFSDGTQYVTLDVSVLDLTDKDFWRDDMDELWQQMRIYKETETDTTKMEQYVYDYIFDAYQNKKIGKKSYTIELVASKDNGSGWLISGDGELEAILQYEKGVDVAKYILDAFDSWYQKTTLQEQLDAVKEEQDRVKKEMSK